MTNPAQFPRSHLRSADEMNDSDSWEAVSPVLTSDNAPTQDYCTYDTNSITVLFPLSLCLRAASKAKDLSLDDILKIEDNATEKQLRTAFIRASLKTHPDDLDDEPELRSKRLHLFQDVGDAYHTLSDETRLRGYNSAKRQKQYFLVEKTSDIEEIQQAYSQQFLDAVKYESEHLDPQDIQLRDDIQRIEVVQPRDDVQKDTEPNAVAEPAAVENDTSQNIDSISPILENDSAGDPSPGNAQLGVIPFDNNPRNSPAGAIKRMKKSIPGPWTIGGVLSGTALGFVIGGPFVIVVAGFGYYGGRSKRQDRQIRV